MIRHRSIATAIAAALLSVAAQSHAALNVDFGETGAPAAELEPGFSAFPLTNATNFQGTFIDYAGTGLDNGAALRVTIDGNSPDTTNQRLVDRGITGWTGGQNALLRDWVAIDADTASDTIVRIANLAPGYYKYRSYHTDISTGGNQSPQFDLLVNDSLQYNNFQVKGQVGSAPTTTPNFLDHVFFADGTNPVELTYRLPINAAGDKRFVALNGFELNHFAAPGDVFRIDLDSTIVENVPAPQPVVTADGWTSLNATAGNGSNVTVDGTTFTVFSADGSRARINNSTPNEITSDFVFDEGAGQAVGLTITNLDRGYYDASVWAWDDAFPTLIGDQIVGLIPGGVGNPEVIIGSFAVNPNDPIVTFRFFADGTRPYSIFTRENNANDRSRFNALQLVAVDIPEPASALLAALGATVLGLRRRRQQV